VNDFVLFGFGFSGAQTGREIDSHGFGDKAGAGVKLQDTAPAFGAVSGFFNEFALGRAKILLAWIDPSCG